MPEIEPKKCVGSFITGIEPNIKADQENDKKCQVNKEEAQFTKFHKILEGQEHLLLFGH